MICFTNGMQEFSLSRHDHSNESVSSGGIKIRHGAGCVEGDGVSKSRLVVARLQVQTLQEGEKEGRPMKQ